MQTALLIRQRRRALGLTQEALPRIPWAKYYCGCTEVPGVLFESKPEKGR